MEDFFWGVCRYAPLRDPAAVPPKQPSVLPNRTGLTRETNDSRPATLPALWVDIDLDDDSPYVGADGLTDYVRLQGDALALGATAGLPRPSLLLRSGRGLWLFWLVREPDDGPVLIGPAIRSSASAIMRALVAVFAPLGADEKSTDLARTCRVPGSSNSASSDRVQWARYSADVYAVEDLASPLAVPLEPAPQAVPLSTEAGRVSPGVHTAKARGSMAKLRRLFADLQTIATDRQGFRQGHRGAAVLRAAICLRGLLYGLEEKVLAQALSFNQSCCVPPLEAAEVRATVRSVCRNVGKHPPLGYDRTAVALGVSAADRDRLQVLTRRSEPFPQERRGITRINAGDDVKRLRALLVARGGEALSERATAIALGISRGRAKRALRSALAPDEPA